MQYCAVKHRAQLVVLCTVSGVIFARNSISIIPIFFKAYMDIIDIISIFSRASWNPRMCGSYCAIQHRAQLAVLFLQEIQYR